MGRSEASATAPTKLILNSLGTLLGDLLGVLFDSLPESLNKRHEISVQCWFVPRYSEA